MIMGIGQAQTVVGEEVCQYLLADKGYDSEVFRTFLEEKQIIPVIPGKKNRIHEVKYDSHIYKERNAIERFFGRIKEFRRIATRYDKTAIMFKAGLILVSILIWIKL